MLKFTSLPTLDVRTLLEIPQSTTLYCTSDEVAQALQENGILPIQFRPQLRTLYCKNFPIVR